MIIDCHGHFTAAPTAHAAYRQAQLAALADARPVPAPPRITDDEIRDRVEGVHLRLIRERGIDLVIFSPQASAMGHHVPDRATAVAWAGTCNDLIHRVTELFPGQFAGACQLPQTPNGPLEDAVRELRRCVGELGFVGCNLNPDPSGGFWTGRPLTDPYWFPLYEALVELDAPAMIHVSASDNPNAHTLGAHYLNADTSVFMQLVEADLFDRFPGLRLVIPHGGGAVPYHWGRFRGIAARLGRPDPATHLSANVCFDTCVYHQPGMRLLLEVVGVDSVLFASEMHGAVRGTDPATGHSWDDTRRYLDRLDLDESSRHKVFEANTLRVYPLLAARLARRGAG